MAARSLAEIDAEIVEAKKKKLELLLLDQAYRKSHGSEFFSPYAWQRNALDLIPKKNITLITAPNKIGKTGLWANVATSWVFGYEPWNKLSDEEIDGAWYIPDKGSFKKSSLGINPPVDIWLSGEEWKVHVGQTLIPELKKWLPEGSYESRRNEQGVEWIFYFKNGSKLMVNTYTQSQTISESFVAHGWLPDEPPPEKMFAGMSRGVFLTGGKVVMFLTPLKEAWILDNIKLSGRSDIGIVDGLTVLANEDVYEHDHKILVNL